MRSISTKLFDFHYVTLLMIKQILLHLTIFETVLLKCISRVILEGFLVQLELDI